MSGRTPQVGDTITTAEQLDALPVGSAVLAGGKDAWTHVLADKYTDWLGIELSEDDHYIEPRQHWLRDAASERGGVILYLPGHPPRPERIVKAGGLREWADAWDATLFIDGVLGPDEVSIEAAHARHRADRIEGGAV